jgi:hypothetical protein
MSSLKLLTAMSYSDLASVSDWLICVCSCWNCAMVTLAVDAAANTSDCTLVVKERISLWVALNCWLNCVICVLAPTIEALSCTMVACMLFT